ncbi:MAG: TIGR00282 family metallophosphoesterase [Acidobacteria bacterium]|nr:TIGR00282 family metallophosphoesterase [Acidobacteriota bacterium]MBI3656529.1 TIGR00282 family metallophosphoesterase [Acidobacteriota bacterium]
MNLLFIGDVVGRTGRTVLFQNISHLIQQHHIDFTIANVENAAGGFGVTPEIADEFLAHDIDLLTSGNHIWDKREIFDYLNTQPRLLRPANYPPGNPGTGAFLGCTKQGLKVAVLNIQGRAYMPTIDCPFRVADAEIDRLRKETNIIIVDMHGEATAEKMAFGWYVDGRVSAVLGTHTHVPTADARILPMGTAYITDVGMTGPYHSVIGMNIEDSWQRLIYQQPKKFEPAKGDPRISGVIVEIDAQSGGARRIERLHERYEI